MLKRSTRVIIRWLSPAIVVPIAVRVRLLRLAGLQVGQRVHVRAGFRFLGGNVVLGDEVLISDGCYFEDHDLITIGDRTWIGAETRILSATHDIGSPDKRAGIWRTAPVRIGLGCWLGAGVTVLPGVSIGDGCVIGAGAVVTKNCAANGLYAGVPAVRRRDL